MILLRMSVIETHLVILHSPIQFIVVHSGSIPRPTTTKWFNPQNHNHQLVQVPKPQPQSGSPPESQPPTGSNSRPTTTKWFNPQNHNHSKTTMIIPEFCHSCALIQFIKHTDQVKTRLNANIVIEGIFCCSITKVKVLAPSNPLTDHQGAASETEKL